MHIEPAKFRNIFSDRSKYITPAIFQRARVWDFKTYETLANLDIELAKTLVEQDAPSSSSRTYVAPEGSVKAWPGFYFQKENSSNVYGISHLEIGDGLQRTTNRVYSLAALYRIVTEMVKDYPRGSDEYIALQDIQERIYTEQVGESSYLRLNEEKSKSYYWRLQSNDINDRIFGDILMGRVREKEVNSTLRSYYENYDKVFEIFDQYINGSVEFVEKISKIKRLEFAILEGRQFGAYYFESFENMGAAFLELNTEGVKLKEAAKIKVDMIGLAEKAGYSQVDIDDKLNFLEFGEWVEDANNYLDHAGLLYYVTLAQLARNSERFKQKNSNELWRSFQEYLSETNDSSNYVNLLDTILENKDIYLQMITNTATANARANRLVEAYDIMVSRGKFSQIIPVLLALYKKFGNESELDSAVTLIENWFIRRKLSGKAVSTGTTEFLTILDKVATSSELENYMLGFYGSMHIPSDSDLGASLDQEMDTQLDSLLVGVFVKLENMRLKDMGSKEPIRLNQFSPKHQVEHVLPQKVNEDFSYGEEMNGISPDNYQYHANNLGNLTILPPDLNGSLGNALFEGKVGKIGARLRTLHFIAQEVFEQDRWNSEKIIERKDKLKKEILAMTSFEKLESSKITPAPLDKDIFNEHLCVGQKIKIKLKGSDYFFTVNSQGFLECKSENQIFKTTAQMIEHFGTKIRKLPELVEIFDGNRYIPLVEMENIETDVELDTLQELGIEEEQQ